MILLCVAQAWQTGIRCQLCHMMFNDHSALSTHYDTAHAAGPSTERRHECELCGKKFTEKGNMKKHLSTVHSDVKSFQCGVCSKTFTQKGNLKAHLNKVHKMSA